MSESWEYWYPLTAVKGIREEVCRHRGVAPILCKYIPYKGLAWQYPKNTRTKSRTAWLRDGHWREQQLAMSALRDTSEFKSNKDFVNLCILAYGTGKLLPEN